MLLRHPPVGVPTGLCYGRSEVALRPGWQDALHRLAGAVGRSRPAMILCSPAARCLEPARLLADLLQQPLRIDADLLELDFGAWEGLTWDQVPRAALEDWAADPLGFAPPGGESGAALLQRVGRVAAGLRRERRNALVVSHGGPLRVLPSLLRGETPDLLAPAPAMGAVQTLCLP